MEYQQLVQQIKQKKSFLCVGLDPDMEKLPAHLRTAADPFFEFNTSIVDATADLAVGYKPNLAFYEAMGLKGWESLKKTIQYIKGKYPEQFIIADAKRGDIGNTSKKYAEAVFHDLNADAITLAPYMGEDSVKPFLDFKGKWAILLALTSNPGAADFQMQQFPDGELLFEKVVKKSAEWGTQKNMMLVVGATKASLLEKIRAIAPWNFLLVPGVGAQGGSLEEVVKHGINPDCGLLVNAARSIIYAGKDEDFAHAARESAAELQGRMAELLWKYEIIE